MDEINRLERLGVNSVLGMALYTGKLNFDELVKLSKEFSNKTK